MRPDGTVTQRGLLDRRILFADGERPASYVFPFIDRRWRVPFVLVDLGADPPMVLDGPLRLDLFRFRTPLRASELRRIESVSIADLAGLIHYDPWWVFRRVSNVDYRWRDAVFATNVAAPFRHADRMYKIRDLVFSATLDRLAAIDAKGGLFRAKAFRPGDIDLLAIRPRAP